MPNTAHGITYPDSTGNVQLWTHFQNLATTVETALVTNETDTGWINVGGGVVTGTLRYRTYRGIVYVHFDGSATTVTGVTLTLNPSNALPSNVWPSVVVRTGGYFSGYAGVCWVDTAGNIVVWQQTGSNKTSVSGMIIYPTG